jgi:hypothetical protein
VEKYFSEFHPDNTHTFCRIYAQGYKFPEDIVDTIIVVILVLLLLGSFPIFPYSRDWGYRGSGGIGTVLLIVIILVLLHVI